ncbi:MAG: ABC transporter permease subunit, partial [Clostridiales bacterium]|nr:ABC transporter permease subunit [Clostridiales bacterium]
VLSIMILPSIISVSETSLSAVPKEYEEGSLALGATEMETYFKVSLPAARSGVAAGIVLGIGRAVGEAMAVMMVAGNVANMPGLFTSVTFLTTAIAKEMSYSSGLQRQALYSIGLILFLFIMIINTVMGRLLKKGDDDKK